MPVSLSRGLESMSPVSPALNRQGDEWLFAPDTHDRGLRVLHIRSGKAYPVLHGQAPFYKP